MELRHLRYFVALAESMHFSRAAARLGVAQQSLSEQIRNLETEIGATLIERSQPVLRLTPAGVAFLAEARVTLHRSDAAVAAAQRAAAGLEGALSIGFCASAAYAGLADIVREFRTARPSIEVQLHELSSADQVRALESDTIDVGFLGIPIAAPSILTERFRYDPLVVALAASHPLAREHSVALEALQTLDLIGAPRAAEPAFADATAAVLHRFNVTARWAQLVHSKHGILALVAAGVGAAVVPATMASLTWRGVVFRPLASCPPTLELGLAWRRRESDPAVQSFAVIARQWACSSDGTTGAPVGQQEQSVGLALRDAR